mmetsp:Transcript_12949/g.26254  ORF Transcript_12949/g.26254 Transcript_12949/m.26254 type:complete len:263 (-) Transcript_12949:1033-1821(-)|eukprot:CAMPEP_0184683434 /NCGR_PEP_ID=MMETSP0312-20130426/11349_1 /TAXON_ID=31354 /ORGANISM="Compsopogon coeruleus, Strain SAG 36.94" /LENGTH=262 /DNA_ID=CAMNT_0027135797 /DNA_START=274 /DNA_END=1062 /DNA_ORIENTATION=+
MKGGDPGTGVDKVTEMASAISRVASELGKDPTRLIDSLWAAGRVGEWEDVGTHLGGSDPEAGPLGDNSLFDDSHLFDEACALCQKCQMRKRLERRRMVRSRGSKIDEDAEAWSEDNRRLEDLLNFIGQDEFPQEADSNAARKARRNARRKKKMDLRRDEGTSEPSSAGSPGSGDSRVCLLPQSPDHPMHPMQGERIVDDLDLLSISSIPSREGDPSQELSLEEREALDREVEEFRLRLESVAVPVGGRQRPAIIFDPQPPTK